MFAYGAQPNPKRRGESVAPFLVANDDHSIYTSHRLGYLVGMRAYNYNDIRQIRSSCGTYGSEYQRFTTDHRELLGTSEACRFTCSEYYRHYLRRARRHAVAGCPASLDES